MRWVPPLPDDGRLLSDVGYTERAIGLLTGRLRAAGVAVTLDEMPGGHVAVFVTGRAGEGRATAFLAEQLGG